MIYYCTYSGYRSQSEEIDIKVQKRLEIRVAAGDSLIYPQIGEGKEWGNGSDHHIIISRTVQKQPLCVYCYILSYKIYLNPVEINENYM